MKKFDKAALSLIYSGYALSLIAVPAHAYIDPSAVTYTIQAVAGIVIAAGSAIVIFRHKISAFFRKKFGKADTAEKKEIHLKDDDSGLENK